MGLYGAVLRIHGPGKHGDNLSQQGLGLGRVAGRDDDTCALITHRHGLIQPTRHGAHGALRNLGTGDRARSRPLNAQRAQVGGAKQEPLVRRIDWGGLHPDQDLIGGGGNDRLINQRQFQFATRGNG